MGVTNSVTKFVTQFVTSHKKLVTSTIEMYLQSGTVWVVHLCHTLMNWVKFQHFEDDDIVRLVKRGCGEYPAVVAFKGRGPVRLADPARMKNNSL